MENIQYNHIDSIRSLYLKDEGTKTINLPDGIIVQKSYQDLVIANKGNIENKIEPSMILKYQLECGKVTRIPDLNLEFIAYQYEFEQSIYERLLYNNDKNRAFFDYDKLKFPLIIRKRQPGDRFQPLNSNFFKKVKSYFIDKKIVLSEREKIMLVTDSSNQIIWIAGFQIDNRFKVSKNTRRILYIEKKQGNTLKMD